MTDRPATNRIMSGPLPRIVVTLAAPEDARDEARARAKNDLYLDGVRRAGGAPIPLDRTSAVADRDGALASMDGLLLSGGADIDPSMYGQEPAGAVATQPQRDELERAAWDAARRRGIPILGICRGMQAINVLSGGMLLQHVEGHERLQEPGAPTRMHPLRLSAGSRLARILRPVNPGPAVLRVNSSHHQAVSREVLAPGLAVAATSPSPGGELVEAVESRAADDFVIGVQCHPERIDSTPPEFERLWTVFIDAARGSATGRRVG